MLDYTETYARTFGLEPRFGEEVVSAKPRDGRWEGALKSGATLRAMAALFYLVYNEGLNPDRYRLDPVLPFTSERTILLKYTYTLPF